MKTTRKYIVPAYICNSEMYLKTRYLLNMMFEVAFDQADIVEKSVKDEKLAWIVYSWDVEILDAIKYKDELEITTFAIDMRKFYAYRNFQVKRDGKTIARAFCSFVLFDSNQKSLVRIPKALMQAYGQEDAIYEGRKNKYSKELDDFDIEKNIEIRKADIDVNYHVNNAAYMEIVRQVVDIKDQYIGYFSIVYKNEIRDKEEVLARAKFRENQAEFLLKSDGVKAHAYGKIEKRNV